MAQDLAQIVLTAISLLLLRFINTGDRMLDNALTTFVMAMLNLFIANTGAAKYYNMFIYYLWDRPKTPFNANAALYKHPNLSDWNCSWRDEVLDRYVSRGPVPLGTMDTKVFSKLRPGLNFSMYLYCVWVGTPVYIRLNDEDDNHEAVFSCTDPGVLASVVEYHTKTYAVEAQKPDVKPQGLYALGDSNEFNRKGDISVRKTFDHIFYDQKPAIMAMLDKFKAGTMYPDTICMDNKLGILLYGPPGTGKTGTISAIANYFKRDVLLVNFSEVTTCAQLDEILRPAHYGRYIYVFDEFDCILNVLVGQGNSSSATQEEEKPADKTDWATMLAVAEGNERRKILEMMREGSRKEKKPDKIDLAYLLQKLDGIEDATGRLIIATTNYPQNINPALLRPGRFDLRLCLGNCSTAMYQDILAGFYKGGETERAAILSAGLEPARWSPLQVINTALMSTGLEETLRQLKAAPGGL